MTIYSILFKSCVNCKLYLSLHLTRLLTVEFLFRCSDKNLSFKYHDCREAERDGRGNQLFRASLTVNGVTVVRKGVTLDVAKNKAASHMISFLEENPHAMMNSSEKGISLSHPSSKLGEM